MAAPKKRTPAPAQALQRPRSAAHFGLNLLGLAGGMATIYGLAHWAPLLDAFFGPLPWHMGSIATNHLLVALAGCGVVFLIIGAGELFWRRSYLNPATGLSAKALRPADPERVAIRLLGFAATLAVIGFVYWLFPEYSLDAGNFYGPFWGLLRALAVPVLVLAPFYFAWTDSHLEYPHDAYWHLGLVVLGRGEQADRSVLPQHFMGWTVKSFFLPLMMNYLVSDVRSIGNQLAGLDNADAMGWYHFLYDTSYTVDLLFCVVGYAITLRLFDSHIRSTEPTAFGWLIAILCYQPFYSIIGSTYLRYDDSVYWDSWLAGTPAIEFAWGATIVVLVYIYSFSTVAFGLRFSNLTYRGIITSGPYRFCKHPAYLSKNLSWWLISVPWIAEHHWYEALRNCCLLGLLNLVYYLRARTEENHLSKDPDYVAYALWMDQHGPLRHLGRLFPVLRYKPPATAAAPQQAVAAARA